MRPSAVRSPLPRTWTALKPVFGQFRLCLAPERASFLKNARKTGILGRNMTDTTEPASKGVTTPLPTGMRRYALSILLIVYIFNFLDRQVVNILAEAIKEDLDLADWQLGMLTGLAFALFYTVLGLPIARLAERANRVRIISIAVGVWSLFTIACGLAANFIQLLLARIGVGVGEAGCTPPAHSLISDYVPAEKRGSAIAFYSMGIPLGSLAGMALGGLVADNYGWRMAFIVAGTPGLLLALLVFLTLPETRKNTSMAAKASDGPSLGDAIRELTSKTAFWWIAVGAAFNAMVGYGHIAFYGSFYARNHAEGLTAMAANIESATGLSFGLYGLLGLVLGLLIGIFGAVGTWIGGFLTDKIVVKDARGFALIPAAAGVVSIPFFLAAFLVGSASLSLFALALLAMAGAIWYGPVFASAQSLVQARTRATASALLLFIINLVGLGFGPLLVGILSDFYASWMGPAEGLRWSMLTAGGIGMLCILAFYMASRTIRDQIEG